MEEYDTNLIPPTKKVVGESFTQPDPATQGQDADYGVLDIPAFLRRQND